MFFGAFEEFFDQAYTQVIEHKEDDFSLLLYYSVKAWCDILNFSSETKDYILENTENTDNQELPRYIWEEYEGTTYYITRKNLKDIVEKIFKKYLYTRSNKTKLILIIAFGFTAVNYLLYLINQNNEGQVHQNTNESPSLNSSKVEEMTSSLPPVTVKNNQVLILVINVSKSKVVKELEAKGKVDSKDCEMLYRATESLWLGDKTDLSSQLSQSFSANSKFAVSPSEESEYNIYLIKIELSEADEGFKANAGQLDRIDAFRRLADLSTNVEVSPRLKVEASENTGVYSR